MKMYKLFVFAAFTHIVLIGSAHNARAQGGDQILDGIGETGMIARYLFDGNVRDWSRNNLHAEVNGVKPDFVEDDRFGKVLFLSGEKDAFLRLPAETLADVESLSVSGWIKLKSDHPGQYFFDFGQYDGPRLFVTPLGTADDNRFQTELQVKIEEESRVVGPPVTIDKWVHIAVVVDIPSKSLMSYVDGKPIGDSTSIEASLIKLFDVEKGKKQALYIGRSISDVNFNLNALLHDFRIYRVPLTKKQISGIYYNALKDIHEDASSMGKAEDDLQKFTESTPQLYNAYLTEVFDIKVDTEPGDLPRLPNYLKGTYQNGIKGPKVRVIWPSDRDNSAALKIGTYTITGRIPGTNLRPKAFVNVKQSRKSGTPRVQLEAFDLDQVSLDRDARKHDTKFIENRDKFINTLAQTDPNTFLYMFRNAFGKGQPAGARALGVWDSQDTKLRGHATGHYLTAVAQAYAGSGYDEALQANFQKKMEYMVSTLYELSQLSGRPKPGGATHVSDPTAVPVGSGRTSYDSDLTEGGIRTDYWNWGEGFISAYPPDQFIMLEKGASYGGQNNQVWAPYYTLHKILAGLMDVYEVSGNEKALAIAKGMSNWVYARLSQLPPESLIKMWNTYIAGEFGGMNEAMARLYRLTNDSTFLKTAQLFDNIELFFGDAEHSHGLAKNVDSFRGLHANQHIPQIVGSIALYQVGKNPEYYKVADNFWYKAVNDYMYSIGGVAGARNPANAECFIAQPATLYENGFSAGGQNETCASYNMLKLSSSLFMFDQRAELMDYYERALYNHILASVAEDSPANTYHVPLRPGAVKQFGNPNMTGFTCCNGTAIESSTKLQHAIYFKSKKNEALFVNLYIPSTLKWEERGITIRQSTNFPKEDQTRLTISGTGKFDVHVRVPSWATKGFFVSINGRKKRFDAKPGSYLKISRSWKSGDVIDLKMPFQFHLDPVMDQQNIASLFYGPILLAAQESEAKKEWRKIKLNAKDISKSIQGDPEKLEFSVDDVLFKPFYETYGRHSVYLDVQLQ